MNKKLLVLGYGRHGKDTVCEILRDNYNFTFSSSSEFLCKKVIYPALKDKYGYKSYKECFADRHNHRAEWFDLISSYNEPDPTRLAKEIFKEYDIYAGLRSKRELDAIKAAGLVDYLIWVDRSNHLLPESKESMDFTKESCDFILDNNGSLKQLKQNVHDAVILLNLF